jgi:UDP-arabinose 4-epimerase
MKVLVTGGAGYIGSHTCKLLAAAGHEPITFDNLSTGHDFLVRFGPLVRGDLADGTAIRTALADHRPDAVIHFAASAYVGDSVRSPRAYYRNNVAGMLNLLDAMADARIGRMIFSSSCATYGIPQRLPIGENDPQSPINPYGDTKLVGERMMRAVVQAEGLACIALRYFNASGADPDGELGELHDPETHVIPLLLESIINPSETFSIFGDDYSTPDGTCIRDYLHVTDLARAHVLALERLTGAAGFDAINLGTGKGQSVRQLVETAERVTGRPAAIVTKARRPGDPPELVADSSKAKAVLGWEPDFSDPDTIIETAWRWRQSARYHEQSNRLIAFS